MTNEVSNQPAARLWELFNVFAQIGLFTIGGGAVMLPFIQKAVVEDKRWLNDEEFADMLAITNSAPGAFTINASIYIGYTQRGLIGSTAAMLGMVTPSIVIILILAYLILQGQSVEWLQQLFAGVRPIVAALLLDAALKLRSTMVKTKFDVCLLLLGLAMLLLASINTVLVIICGAILGVLYPRIRRYRQAEQLPKDDPTVSKTDAKAEKEAD